MAEASADARAEAQQALSEASVELEAEVAEASADARAEAQQEVSVA